MTYIYPYITLPNYHNLSSIYMLSLSQSQVRLDFNDFRALGIRRLCYRLDTLSFYSARLVKKVLVFVIDQKSKV